MRFGGIFGSNKYSWCVEEENGFLEEEGSFKKGGKEGETTLCNLLSTKLITKVQSE